MKIIRVFPVLMLCGAMLLTGCGLPGTGAGTRPAAGGPAETESKAPEQSGTDQTVVQQTEVSAGETATAMPAEVAVPEHGMLVHIERMSKEAYDPESGTTRILTFEWDNVRVDSDEYPQAAKRMTEEMAKLQDAWYTGSGNEEGDVFGYGYGYNVMLEAAEDNYAVYKEYGGIPSELASTQYVTVLRADEDVCIFQVNSYIYLGGAHGTYASEAFCFDARTGEQLHLENLSADAGEMRGRLVAEMIQLVENDNDGYYADRISFVAPENYETAFSALLRDGAWYPGTDAFHLSSEVYELGPYAAGITDFSIPYERLEDLMDRRWLPKTITGTSDVGMIEMPEIREGSVDIVDQVVIGDGGETGLIVFYGEARDISIWTAFVGHDDQFYADQELFYCDRMSDCALQLALLFPGDLPNTMLRFRDSEGEHEYLIGLSGENGRIILIENPPLPQG